jgi:predicted nucleic acid-binding protein
LSSCVLDTDVVIAALDRRDDHHKKAARAITAMIEDKSELLISTINYAEALVRPAESERALDTAVDAIAALGIRPVAPTAVIARDAARFRALKISLAEGFALATARAHGSGVASFDRRVRQAMATVGLQPPAQLR